MFKKDQPPDWLTGGSEICESSFTSINSTILSSSCNPRTYSSSNNSSPSTSTSNFNFNYFLNYLNSIKIECQVSELI